VSQFEGDNRMDEHPGHVWIEEDGGGTGQESYELCAYFYSRTNAVRLDVDMNISGETTKPVENMRWAKGTAPKGRYRVYVQSYGYKAGNTGLTDFRVEVEVEVGGVVRQFDGAVSLEGETGPDSNVLVYELDHDPEAKLPAPAARPDDPYARYSDDVILKQWATVIPSERPHEADWMR